MNQLNWYIKCLKQYADFKGRARRSEFWYFCLFNVIASVVATLIDSLLGFKLVSSLYSLAVFIPGLAVAVRRLHDIGKSGWFYLIGLIPVIGWIWLIILFCKEGQPEANQWGNNPKAE